jgi:hypothetical protein
LGAKRTFLRQCCHLRVDGARHLKSFPSPSALGGKEALILALVEVNELQPLRILLIAASGRHALHRSPEATGGWNGQKASSCEQPVRGGWVRVAQSAPLAAMSHGHRTRPICHQPGRPSQPTPFSLVECFASPSQDTTTKPRLFLLGSQYSTRAA